MIVEDNRGDSLLIREALREYNVRANLIVLDDGELALNHIAAIEAGEAPCPNLIILDLNLPKRNGREVIEQLRRGKVCGQVAVVVLSSSDAEQDRADAARLGANLYIRKPLQLEEFIKIGSELKRFLPKSL